MFCTECGKEVTPGDGFCGNCGAAVQSAKTEQPQEPAPRTLYTGPQAPPPAPPAFTVPPAVPPVPVSAAKKGFFSSPAGKALAVVVALLVVAGAAVGIYLVVKSGSEGDARAKADKVTAQAEEDLGAAGDELEDMDKAVASIDFKDIGQATPQVEKHQSQLDKTAKAMDDTRDDLEGLDTGKLTQEQRDRIEALLSAADEYARACKEMNDLLERSLAVGEFEGCMDATVSQFNTLVETVNQGVAQHNADQYADALNAAQAAKGMLNQARAYLNRAKELEPGADLSYHFGNLDNTERFLNTFVQICETALAGDYATHDALVDQSWGEDNSVSGNMGFDYDTYFGEELDRANASIDKRLEAAAGYLKDAEQ